MDLRRLILPAATALALVLAVGLVVGWSPAAIWMAALLCWALAVPGAGPGLAKPEARIFRNLAGLDAMAARHREALGTPLGFAGFLGWLGLFTLLFGYLLHFLLAV